MTVIRRIQQNCEYPNSTNASDTESVHLASASASDVESDFGELITHDEPCASNILRIRVPIFEDLNRIKKSSGKRKQRRFKNRTELQVLSEEDEDDVTFIKLMDNCKSPFERLMEDKCALSYWNDFTNLSEAEQRNIIDPMPKQPIQDIKIKAENPLSRISSKIKRAMKIKKNMPVKVMQKMENELLDYFNTFPGGAFLSTPFTSFERLLLHAIAQYHNLKSISLIEMTIRCVEISSPINWTPMEMSFCDFVQSLRQ